MIDIQYIRDNPEKVTEKSAQKGYSVDVDSLLSRDSERSNMLQRVEGLRRQRNENADAIKNSQGKPDQALIENGKRIKKELSELESQLKQVEEHWLTLLKAVPNMPLDDVPVGASEDENVIVREVGQKPRFDFAPKNHAQIAEKKGWIDKERAAKVSGSRFAYLKGEFVRLQWAMMQFGLDCLMNEDLIEEMIQKHNLNLPSKPFTPVLPPHLLKTEVYDAMDRLEPREDRYKIEGEELWLQGSAEHVLGSMHSDEVIAEADLPLRYVGYATSFRREAGTYGKDMEGIIRMHQFDKLEMQSIVVPETSLDEHKLTIALQEHLMQQLGLTYRVLDKCSADIGKPNARGWDIDAWLPGQDKYRETHTADYMTDYQARRLRTRVRRHDGVIELVHTNDATAFSQRPLIAIIENYQTEEGNVTIPEVLKPYMGGKEQI